MFPTYKVSLTGLDPTSKYIVYMDVVPVDNHRYKYHNSQWMITGAAEPHSKWSDLSSKISFIAVRFLVPGRFYPHPDSNSTGAQLMKQPLSFSKLKLTNNTTDQNGHVSSEERKKSERGQWFARLDCLEFHAQIYSPPSYCSSCSFVDQRDEIVHGSVRQCQCIRLSRDSIHCRHCLSERKRNY